jgi:hypothetical protein
MGADSVGGLHILDRRLTADIGVRFIIFYWDRQSSGRDSALALASPKWLMKLNITGG